jgi:hypothetical protein
MPRAKLGKIFNPKTIAVAGETTTRNRATGQIETKTNQTKKQ